MAHKTLQCHAFNNGGRKRRLAAVLSILLRSGVDAHPFATMFTQTLPLRKPPLLDVRLSEHTHELKIGEGVHRSSSR